MDIILKTGPGEIDIPVNSLVRVISETDHSCEFNGELVPRKSNRETRFTSKEDGSLSVNVQSGVHWSVDIQTRRTVEDNDGIPFEVPGGIDRELTLQEKIERFLTGALAEKFGREQMETFAEAMDFDLDDDGDVELSGYEVLEMAPDGTMERKARDSGAREHATDSQGEESPETPPDTPDDAPATE